ncbi:hypothetical protein Tco_0836165 [Tanacetum coccineum]
MNPNFIDWLTDNIRLYFNLDMEYYREHPIPVAPAAQPGQQIPPEYLAAHAAWVKGKKEVVELLLQNLVREFHHLQAGKVISVNSLRSKILKGYIDNLERLGQPVGQNLAGDGHGAPLKQLNLSLKLPRVFQNRIETNSGRPLSHELSDRGGETIVQELLGSSKGIHGSLPLRTPPTTPQNNGVQRGEIENTARNMVRSNG